jgi:biotin carboxylase
MNTSSPVQNALILGGTSAHIPLLLKLKERGYRTLLADYYEQPVAAAFADQHHRISTLDKEAILALALAEQASLVISTCVDQANVTACYVAEQLGLAHPYSYQTALAVSDKVLMKELLNKAGIASPRSLCIRAMDDLAGIDPDVPLIVKPADACGSKGVRVALDAEQLKSFTELAFLAGRSDKVIVEEFIRGREIVCEVLVQDKRVHPVSVYEKFNVYGTSTVVQCFRSLRPVRLEEETLQQLHTIAEGIAKAFGLYYTPLFIQTIVSASGIYVLEFGARAAGGLATVATRESCGFDAVEAVIHSYLGQSYTAPSSHASANLLTTNSIYAAPGVFSHISGQDELLEEGIIDSFMAYKTKGMRIGSDLSSSERIAGFIVKAQHPEELLDKTQKALSRLQVWNEKMQEVMIRKPFLDAGIDHLWYPDLSSQP